MQIYPEEAGAGGGEVAFPQSPFPLLRGGRARNAAWPEPTTWHHQPGPTLARSHQPQCGDQTLLSPGQSQPSHGYHQACFLFDHEGGTASSCPKPHDPPAIKCNLQRFTWDPITDHPVPLTHKRVHPLDVSPDAATCPTCLSVFTSWK